MTPDELRALADALLPMAAAPCFDGIDVERAAAYLRAQADARPVAVPAGWKPVPVEPTPEMLSAVGMMDGYDWHAPGCSPDADHANWYSAMIAAAPAAPQAEPKREDRRGDPPALVAWSWHDLPARAAAMRAALIAAMEIVQRERVRIAYNAKGAPPAIEIGYTDILRRLDAVIAQADAALK